jgi:hypothetical protein
MASAKKRARHDTPPLGCVSVLVRSRQHGRCIRYLVLGDPPGDRRRYARERRCLSSR